MKWNVFFSLILSLFFTPQLKAQTANEVSTEQTQELYQKGLGLYQNKQWEEAAEQWSKALEQEPENPLILFNLGLSQHQLNRPGLSIGFWRKALYVDPGLSAAKIALNKVLEKKGLQKTKSSWSKTVLGFFSLRTWLSLALLTFFATGWLAIGFVAKRKNAFSENLPTPSFPYLLTVASVCTLAMSVGATSRYIYQSQTLGTVINKEVVAKSSPGNQGTDLFQIPEGTEVILKNVSENSVQAFLPGGLSGWVNKENIFQNAGSPLW